MPVNAKGEYVKKQVDKINKKPMLDMIYKKLNMLNSHKNYSKNIFFKIRLSMYI